MLVLDFEDGAQATGGATDGAGGEGGEGGDGAHGGGGATPEGAWVAAFSATPSDGMVSIESIAVAGDTTWLGGYFFGRELRLRDDDGTESAIIELDPMLDPDMEVEVTTFVVALDADGKLKHAIPIAGSRVLESPYQEWLGTRLDVDSAGNVYLLSSYRAGKTMFAAPQDPLASELDGWNLLLMKLTSEGVIEWGSRCFSSELQGEPPAVGRRLSAHYAAVLTITDETIAFGTTVEPSSSIECASFLGDGAACDLPPQLAQSGLVGTLAADGSCDEGVLEMTSHLDDVSEAPTSVWLDGMALDSNGDVLFSGRVFSGGVVVMPWEASSGGDTPLAFTGSLGLDGSGSAEPHFFNSDWRPFVPTDGDVAVGSVLNENGVTDILLSRGDEDIQLGDATDDEKSEIVATVSAHDGFVLIGGHLSEDSAIAGDVCGAACAGDLLESDAGCAFGASTDGFWLLLDPEQNAVGRSFGDCSKQSVVGSHLSADAMTLSVELQGRMTLDLLSGAPREISSGEFDKTSIIARIPRPAAVP